MYSTTVIARSSGVSQVHGWFWHKLVISYYQKKQMRTWCLPDVSFLLCSCRDATDSIQHQLAVILLFWSYFDVYSSHHRLQTCFAYPFCFDRYDISCYLVYTNIYICSSLSLLSLSLSLPLCNLNLFLKLHLNHPFCLIHSVGCPGVGWVVGWVAIVQKTNLQLSKHWRIIPGRT